MNKWFKKWLPTHEKIKNDKNLGWLTKRFGAHPHIWAVNRKTVTRAVAAGLLVAFIPIPLQVFLAAILAFVIRANLPIAIVSTLISNPFTFVPLNFLIYKVGTAITQSNGNGMPPINDIEFHWESISLVWGEMMTWFKSLGKSYFIGLLAVSVGASIIGYILAQIFWLISTRRKLRHRKKRKLKHNKEKQ